MVAPYKDNCNEEENSADHIIMRSVSGADDCNEEAFRLAEYLMKRYDEKIKEEAANRGYSQEQFDAFRQGMASGISNLVLLVAAGVVTLINPKKRPE